MKVSALLEHLAACTHRSSSHAQRARRARAALNLKFLNLKWADNL
jgi:hypothetical protein